MEKEGLFSISLEGTKLILRTLRSAAIQIISKSLIYSLTKSLLGNTQGASFELSRVIAGNKTSFLCQYSLLQICH